MNNSMVRKQHLSQQEVAATAALPGAYLSREQQDALGEMGNVCMGTEATALSSLLGCEVRITTPVLSLYDWDTLVDAQAFPLVVIVVEYTTGLSGRNMLILKEQDVRTIAALLLGEEENPAAALEEAELSAICEVMNQMVGSAATALASMLHRFINISIPQSVYALNPDALHNCSFTDRGDMIKIAFQIEIEGLLSSEVMQVMPIEFARSISDELLDNLQSSREPGACAKDTPHNAALPMNERAAKDVRIIMEGSLVARGALQYQDGVYTVCVTDLEKSGVWGG